MIKEILIKEVKIAFSKHIKDYSLVLEETGLEEYSVFLVSSSYILGIHFDHYGMDYTYTDFNDKSRKVYNIFKFLSEKRVSKLVFYESDKSDKPYTESIPFDLLTFSDHLKNAGKDILEGKKTWLKQYIWPTGTMSEKLFRQLCP